MEAIKFMYFLHNFSLIHLDELFEHLGNKQHFTDKFSGSFGNSGTQKLMNLFMTLTTDNQLKFVEWANENYKGK